MATSVSNAVSDFEPGTARSNFYGRRAHLLPNNYDMNHRDRGYAVIINNKTFNGLLPRYGTDCDRNNMKSLLISMGFQENHIIVENNCSATRMKEVMEGVAERYSGQDYDCFVAVILSHGKDGEIVGMSENDTCPVDELTKPFKGKNCEDLIGKPKIFLVQMCRGEDEDTGVQIPSERVGHDADEDECNEIELPSEGDFLLAFAVAPGYKAWREDDGSWFIKSIVEVFRRDEQWRREDLVSMLTEVNKTVAIDYGNEDLKQMPFFSSTLMKKVIFSDRL